MISCSSRWQLLIRAEQAIFWYYLIKTDFVLLQKTEVGDLNNDLIWAGRVQHGTTIFGGDTGPIDFTPETLC